MADRMKQLAVGLAAFQALDVIGNALAPRHRVTAHLNRLGVPVDMQPLLSPIKLASSAGLIAGLRLPRLGKTTAAALVAYYAAAAQFHLGAGDRPISAAPAAALCAASALVLVRSRSAEPR